MIELKNVGFVRDGKALLHDINWRIEPGENWVLFGRNGSGKTLVLNHIEGYLHPTTGSIVRFGEESGLDLREMRKQTGYVGDFVKRSIKPYHTVMNTVLSGKFATVGLYDRIGAGDEDNALKWMEVMECVDLRERTMEHLSDGERMRVLIARSLMAEPDLLILDEPCSGLDIASREEFLSILERLNTRYGKTLSMIFVTHHVDEIIPAFTKMIILNEGTVFRSGTVEELLTSEIIGQALGIPVKIVREYGRYMAVVKHHS